MRQSPSAEPLLSKPDSFLSTDRATSQWSVPDGPTPLPSRPPGRGPAARPCGDAAVVPPRRRCPRGRQPAGRRRSGPRTAASTASAAARAHLERESRHDPLVAGSREGLQGFAEAGNTPHARHPAHPRLNLEVPVYDGTADAVLDLAAGRIEETALPGTPGNVGIAAHRDGFFRVLKDIKEGDALVLDTPVATEHYRVQSIRITTPEDVSVIDPTPTPAVTLVGCYPFYHQGSAPKRFIVRAVPAAGSPSGS